MKHFRRLALSVVVLFSCFGMQAQQNHFIYLQTENRQPFYVKMGKVIYNSTVSGYLIISKLKEGNYDFLIGFVNAEKGEQEFRCTVSRQDVGYILRQFGEKGWGLFNLQTLQVTMAGVKENNLQNVPKNTTVKTDDFSQMLSTVVNDPAIKYEQKELPAEKIKPDTAVSEGEKGTAPADKKIDAVSEKPSDIDPVDKIAAPAENAMNKPGIVKRSSISDKNGLNLIYLDRSDDQKVDTITMLIPLDDPGETIPAKQAEAIKHSLEKEETTAATVNKSNKAATTDEDVTNEETAKPVAAPVNKQEVLKTNPEQDKKFLNIDLPVSASEKKDSIQDSDNPQNSAVTGLIVSSNTSCNAYGNESDFLKLRKKMAAAGSEDDMLKVAKKAFKSKCYSTEQVKNLAVLFLDDAGRYNFFDLAYPHVYDLNNFSQLREQVKDEYYKKRFDAMLRQ